MGQILGKYIRRVSLQNGRRPMKLRKQGNYKATVNLLNGGKPKRQREPVMTKQTHWYRAWCEIVLKSVAKQKWTNTCYSCCNYFRNTRGSPNKRKQCSQNTCFGEQCDNRGCDCDEDSNSCLEQAMYMYKYKFQLTYSKIIQTYLWWLEGCRLSIFKHKYGIFIRCLFHVFAFRFGSVTEFPGFK